MTGGTPGRAHSAPRAAMGWRTGRPAACHALAGQVRPLPGHLGGRGVDRRGHVPPQDAAGDGDQARDRRGDRGDGLVKEQPAPLPGLPAPARGRRRWPGGGPHAGAGTESGTGPPSWSCHQSPPGTHVERAAEDGRAERGRDQPRHQAQVDGGGGDPRLDLAGGAPAAGRQRRPDRSDAVAERPGRQRPARRPGARARPAPPAGGCELTAKKGPMAARSSSTRPSSHRVTGTRAVRAGLSPPEPARGRRPAPQRRDATGLPLAR